ncbi:hypothetical protein [Anaerovorax sp. IOR16]|uniref:hypothetical protein n=1 Tax=Anaerovorax sp. IOR16 TaxID=2773458 RepID=UPI0019D2C61E|nr:hypothetical protein [Anaerovorax sp. IOR16]
MEKEKRDRLNDLAAKLESGNISGSEKEEHRLLNMEYLAEIIAQQQDEDDEDE